MKIDQSRNKFSHMNPPVAEIIEKDECEIRTTDFRLSFVSDGGGYGFDCLSDGTILEERLNDCSRNSLKDALSREWEKVQVLTHTIRDRLCMCGSGKRCVGRQTREVEGEPPFKHRRRRLGRWLQALGGKLGLDEGVDRVRASGSAGHGGPSERRVGPVGS